VIPSLEDIGQVNFGKIRFRRSRPIMDERAISFGSFRIRRRERLLLEGDTPLRLGSRAFDLLIALDDAEYRLRALWGLWAYHNGGGRHRVALELAQRFYALAAERPDPNDRLSGEGIIGVSQHYLGDLPSAIWNTCSVVTSLPTKRRTLLAFRPING
jgi:hypothetical protein